jgi:hypothetical protein
MGAILPPLFSGHNYLFARHVRTVYNRMIHVGVYFYAIIIKAIFGDK